MNPKLKTLFFFLIGAFAGILTMYLISNYKIEKRNLKSDVGSQLTEAEKMDAAKEEDTEISFNENSIQRLTDEKNVISYIKSHHKLPDFYITKSQAKKQGWVPSKGNLCDVLPGKAIGGDHFSNREKQLPKGDLYYEADVNYNCGNRGADRIIFTKNGDVWLTKDHYRSFIRQ